jgi:hypothetical protein
VWHENAFFAQSLQVVLPYFTSGNNSFGLAGNFDQFFPKQKLTLRFGGNVTSAKSFYGINNENTPILLKTVNFNIDLVHSFWRQFKLDFSNRFVLSQNTIATPGSLKNNLFSWKTDVSLLWRSKSWFAALVLNRTYFTNKGQNPVNLLTTTCRLRKQINFKNSKQANLMLNIYNLQNTRNFSSLQRSDYFLYLSTVEAIPAFFVLSLDIPL